MGADSEAVGGSTCEDVELVVVNGGGEDAWAEAAVAGDGGAIVLTDFTSSISQFSYEIQGS